MGSTDDWGDSYVRPTYQPWKNKTPVITVPGAAWAGSGLDTGGEESSSKEASDHVDDYGNTPVVSPYQTVRRVYPNNPPVSVGRTVVRPPMTLAPVKPRPAPAVPTATTPENMIPPVAPGAGIFDGFKLPEIGMPDLGDVIGGVLPWAGVTADVVKPVIGAVDTAFDMAGMLPMLMMMMMFRD